MFPLEDFIVQKSYFNEYELFITICKVLILVAKGALSTSSIPISIRSSVKCVSHAS